MPQLFDSERLRWLPLGERNKRLRLALLLNDFPEKHMSRDIYEFSEFEVDRGKDGQGPHFVGCTKVKELGGFEVCLRRTVMFPASKGIEGEQ